jgi:hypothetical protein
MVPEAWKWTQRPPFVALAPVFVAVLTMSFKLFESIIGRVTLNELGAVFCQSESVLRSLEMASDNAIHVADFGVHRYADNIFGALVQYWREV